MEAVNDSTILRVPEDCSTLKEAVERVNDGRSSTTIIVGKGEHIVEEYDDEDGDKTNDLVIPSSMNIIVKPNVSKHDIVVVGGIQINTEIQGNVHVQHMTLRQARCSGVYGKSSFTVEDVIVEQNVYYGGFAGGSAVVGRCTNVEERQCGCSGVYASDGGSITLIGAKTTVHDNCTRTVPQTTHTPREPNKHASTTTSLVCMRMMP